MTDAAHGAAEDPGAQSVVRDGDASTGQVLLAGLRQPIVLILLLIAFFTTISGKPLDGVLMLTVAVLLVWDAARSSRLSPVARPAHASQPAPAQAHSATAVRTDARAAAPGTGRRLLVGIGWLTAGIAYAWIVGAFKRYSWPATSAVVVLGCLMVAIGWQGPLRHRAALTGQALRRTWLWAVVLVAGGLWELSSLLQQPHLTTDSYAHPTISALTDPLLASHPGRSIALGGWLLIGWFLAGR